MISRAEDPEKMLNQLITDMNQQLIDSKKSVASAIADEKKIERSIQNSRQQAEEWERKATLAVKAGKDDLAREALARKKEAEQYAAEYEQQWEQQHASVEKLKASLRNLQQKIEEAQRKKNLLVARAKRAEAQKKIQETMGGMSDTSAFEAFDRMSQQMDQMEAENEAYQELEDTSSQDDLEKQFAELEGSGDETDKQLEELKHKVSLEDQSGSTSSGSQSASSSSSQSGSGEGSSEKQAGSEEVEESLEELKKKMRDEEAAT
jgi:phage shock protein A